MLNIIHKDGKQFVSARELFKALFDNATYYTKWVKKHITDSESSYKEYLELESVKNISRGAFAQDYLLEIHFATYIAGVTVSKTKDIIFDYLQKIVGEKIVLTPLKKEYIFEKILIDFFGSENVVSQKTVLNGKYRLDFVILNEIIVEYDENYHLSKQQQVKDKTREIEINELYKDYWKDDNVELTFVRVKEGEEFLGLRKIMEAYQEVKNCLGSYTQKLEFFGYKGDVSNIFDKQ